MHEVDISAAPMLNFKELKHKIDRKVAHDD